MLHLYKTFKRQLILDLEYLSNIDVDSRSLNVLQQSRILFIRKQQFKGGYLSIFFISEDPRDTCKAQPTN